MKTQLFFCLLFISYWSYGQLTIEGQVYRIIPLQSNTGIDVQNAYCDLDSDVKGVEGVKIEIFATDNSATSPETTQYTDTNGAYSVTFPNFPSSKVRICPSFPEIDYLGGEVTTVDLVLLKGYRLKEFNLCPLRRICADVDDDGILTENDEDRMFQHITSDIPFDIPASQFLARQYARLDLGNRDIHFAMDLWETDFENQAGMQYPFLANYQYDNNTQYVYDAASIRWKHKLHEYLLEDMICHSPNWDFYIMLTGDVSGNGYFPNPSSPFGNDNSANRSSNVQSNSQSKIKSNTQHIIEVKAKTEDLIVGFQLGLLVQTNLLDIISIEPNRLLEQYTKKNIFFINEHKEGLPIADVRMLWVSDELESIDLTEEVTLFSILVEAEADIDLAEAIQLSTDALPVEFVNEAIRLVPASLSLHIK